MGKRNESRKENEGRKATEYMKQAREKTVLVNKKKTEGIHQITEYIERNRETKNERREIDAAATAQKDRQADRHRLRD